MNKVEVFFDFVEVGDQIYVGSIVVEDGEVMGSKAESYPQWPGYNHFHYSLVAWRTGVRNVMEVFEEDDVYDQVVFKNQNGLIFKWARQGECPSEYADLLDNVYKEVTYVLEQTEVDFSFMKIQGKENKVKKMLKKKLEKSGKGQKEEKLGFGGLKANAREKAKKVVGESPTPAKNVVDMRKRKK